MKLFAVGRTVKGEGERWARLANVIMDIAKRAANRTGFISARVHNSRAVELERSE